MPKAPAFILRCQHGFASAWPFSGRGRGRVGTRSATAGPTTPVWDAAQTLARLRLVMIVVGGLTLVLGWQPAERFLRERISQRLVQAMPMPPIRLANAPAWMPVALREQLRAVALAQITPEPMAGRSLERAAAALALNPWVEQVLRVQRYPDGIEILARYRQPVAGVAWSDGYHMVDAKGVSLPGLYLREHLELLKLPAIEGVSTPPAAPGCLWQGQGVQAGLALVSYLGNQPYRDQIVAYDVSDRDALGRVRLTLQTQQGKVRWGLPPGEERSIEPPATLKREWLARVAVAHQSIDAGGRTVDVFGGAAFIHQQPDARDRGSRLTLR